MARKKIIPQHIQLAYSESLKTLGKPCLVKRLVKEQKQKLLFQALPGGHVDLQANK